MMIFRSLMYRAKKHLFPKTMQSSLELAQLDSKKSSQELINLQKQELQIETQILNNLKVLNGQDLNDSLLNAINNDIKQLTESFQLFAVKSFQELQDINQNVKEGLNNINSSLLIINESILSSGEKIVETLKNVHEELKHFIENPSGTAATELRLKARERLESAYASEKHREEDLAKAIKLYKTSLNNEVGETDPMTWLELGYAYSYKKEFENALRAFHRADQYSTRGVIVNHKIKNQALHNIAMIHTSNKNFTLAYPQIKEVTDSKRDYDNSSLILKGVNEVLLGYVQEGISQIKIGLDESPELIKDIYLFTYEGVLSKEFCEKFIVEITNEKKEIINQLNTKYFNLCEQFIHAINVKVNSKIDSLIFRIDTIFSSYYSNADFGFLDLHGKQRELKILIAELESILKSEIEESIKSQQNKLKVKERLNNDHFVNTERQLSEYDRDLAQNNETIQNRLWGWGIFLAIILLITLMSTLNIEGWWSRLGVSIFIITTAFSITRFFVYNSHNSIVEANRGRFKRNSRILSDAFANQIDDHRQYLKKLEKLLMSPERILNKPNSEAYIFSQNRPKKILEEGFGSFKDTTDSNSSWIKRSEYMILTSFNEEMYLWYTKKVNDPIHEYNIEVECKMISGRGDYGFGLIFNYSDSQNFAVFNISNNGHFCINEYINNNWLVGPVNWIRNYDIRASELNKLNIMLIDNWFFFYINETLIEVVQKSSFQSDGLEFGFCSSGAVKEVRFKNFKYFSLNKP